MMSYQYPPAPFKGGVLHPPAPFKGGVLHPPAPFKGGVESTHTRQGGVRSLPVLSGIAICRVLSFFLSIRQNIRGRA